MALAAGLVAPWIGFCYPEDTSKWRAAILSHPLCPRVDRAAILSHAPCPQVDSLHSVLEFLVLFCMLKK